MTKLILSPDTVSIIDSKILVLELVVAQNTENKSGVNGPLCHFIFVKVDLSLIRSCKLKRIIISTFFLVCIYKVNENGVQVIYQIFVRPI